MELIFLSRKDLKIKDHAVISEDFNLIFDSVIYQKSYFVVNKICLNVEIGDIVYLKGMGVNFVGIAETIEISNDFQTKIEATDYSSIFDIKVKVNSYAGNLSIFLANLIKNAFKTNIDPMQNISYLTVKTSVAVNGSLAYDPDTLMSINEISSTLAKTYGIRFVTDIVIENGAIKGILVDINGLGNEITIKSNLSVISKLNIIDSTAQIVNKVTFYPKEENVTKRNVIEYFLLTNGTIVSDKNNLNRYSYVKGVTIFYSDNEFDSLLTKAQTELLKSNLEHNISFELLQSTGRIHPLSELKLGDRLEFISNKKTYHTMVTQIAYKGNFYEASIVLGECRVRLTEKLKILERK